MFLEERPKRLGTLRISPVSSRKENCTESRQNPCQDWPRPTRKGHLWHGFRSSLATPGRRCSTSFAPERASAVLRLGGHTGRTPAIRLQGHERRARESGARADGAGSEQDWLRNDDRVARRHFAQGSPFSAQLLTTAGAICTLRAAAERTLRGCPEAPPPHLGGSDL